MVLLLGLPEVLALLAVGVIAAPLFLRPRHRGASVLIARRFEVGKDISSGVYIEAQQAGLVPWVLALFGTHLTTSLDVGEEWLTYLADTTGGGDENVPLPMSKCQRAESGTTQPKWSLSAIGVIMFLLVVYTGAGRLTMQWAVVGVMASGMSGLACALQRTNNLVIHTTDRRTIVLAFTAVGRSAVTKEDVAFAAARITELATLNHQRQPAA